MVFFFDFSFLNVILYTLFENVPVEVFYNNVIRVSFFLFFILIMGGECSKIELKNRKKKKNPVKRTRPTFCRTIRCEYISSYMLKKKDRTQKSVIPETILQTILPRGMD